MIRSFGDIAVDPLPPTVDSASIWPILAVVAGVAVITAVLIVVLVRKKKGGK